MRRLIDTTLLALILPAINYSEAQPVPADSLFKAYTQDSANNCASIAIIKANLNAFGFNNLFKKTTVNDSTTEYILKDSSKVTVTNSDMEVARLKFRVDSSQAQSDYLKDVLHKSIICYAIMGKKFPKEFPKLSTGTYNGDLDYITDVSFDVRLGINLLGTADYVYFLRRLSSIKGKEGVVVWSPHHTVFAHNYKCDMPGDAAAFTKKSVSYYRFWGRMYFNPEE